MKILLVSNYLNSPNHNQNVWQDLAEHLKSASFEVMTTSSQTNKVVRLLDMLFTIWTQRENYQIAQVDVFSGQAFLWAECCGKLLHTIGKPFVLTLHGGNLPEFSQKHPRRVRKLLGMAGAVTAPSNYLLERMAIYRSDIRLIPNPIEVSNYPFRLRTNPSPAMVWLRAFHQIYNPSMAPKVLANILDECPSASLTMIGPDKGDHSLQTTKEVARHLGATQMIKFPGAVSKNEVPVVLNQGDIFINTTNFDNTPTSVMEALACGLCVVSTNVGGIPYLINHEEDGLLVPPEDPAAMAVVVRRILTEPGLAEKLSRNGRKKAEQFDWSFILPKWESLFRKIAND